MYKIAWRRQGFGVSRSVIQWTRGISRYSTMVKAQDQMATFRGFFPFNDYLVENA